MSVSAVTADRSAFAAALESARRRGYDRLADVLEVVVDDLTEDLERG
jgi:hypothetical protein